MAKPSARLLEADPATFKEVTFTAFVAPAIESVPQSRATRLCNGLRRINNHYQERLPDWQNRIYVYFKGNGVELLEQPDHPFILHKGVDYGGGSPIFRPVYASDHPDRLRLFPGVLYKIAQADMLMDTTNVGSLTADLIVDLLNVQTVSQQLSEL